MAEWEGWFFDLYDDPQGGVILWLLADSGERVRLRQAFPITFYAAGPAERLRALWRWLESQPLPVRLAREERRDLFLPHPVTVLAVEVPCAAHQPRLFRQAARDFGDLTFYDADIPLALRHAARYGTFPLARCRVRAANGGEVQALQVLDTPWELDPSPAPLRGLELEPDCDPAHAEPRYLLARFERCAYRFALDAPRPLLVNLRALLQKHDPDMLLTAWGDTWLLPRLLEMSRAAGLALPLNREPGRDAAQRAQRTYFSYGQIIYRGQQVNLFGRWHIDGHNATLWDDYSLEGTLETARVTALPVQTAARTSPGTGISAMQITTALRIGALVPWRKQQVERPKTALDLLESDQGGLVYQPLVGVHRDVGAIDFISMYPSIMVRGNISPETRPNDPQAAPLDKPGLVPQTLAPLLEKRVALKLRTSGLPAWHPQRKHDQARSTAHKWLLVTCFGYLGYKNARFGRIEAHEAVTAGGREALLRAKEAAEDAGFSVLHMYVDGLWVQKPGAVSKADFAPLLEEVASRTGLSIALDGIYRWVVFLPSRVDGRAPVPNRYFGVFQDGSLKVRGIEARRRDTPRFVAEVQMELLEILAQADSLDEVAAYLPAACRRLRQRLRELRAGEVPPEKLLMGLKLSRKLEAYTSPSPAARAVAQLNAVGKSAEPGQRIRFLWLRGESAVHAWDLPTLPDARRLDLERYAELLLRAAEAVLEPFGVSREKMLGYETALPLFGPRALPVRWHAPLQEVAQA